MSLNFVKFAKIICRLFQAHIQVQQEEGEAVELMGISKSAQGSDRQRFTGEGRGIREALAAVRNPDSSVGPRVPKPKG